MGKITGCDPEESGKIKNSEVTSVGQGKVTVQKLPLLNSSGIRVNWNSHVGMPSKEATDDSLFAEVILVDAADPLGLNQEVLTEPGTDPEGTGEQAGRAGASGAFCRPGGYCRSGVESPQAGSLQP
ncbi:hypothetical protein QYF61_024037 [Mycteria americana]|uniref:Uncharacterized protein n=1 Tax=Mycteria americana TaxID=33587 RepID=A0AAN7MSR3_MYCAM|nr:hypothetical protein QYF61_024037 [Mycteria americana]